MKKSVIVWASYLCLLLCVGCVSTTAERNVLTLPGGAAPITFTLDSAMPRGAIAVLVVGGLRCPLTSTCPSVTILFPKNDVFRFRFHPPKGMEHIGLTLSGNLQNFYLRDPAGVFGKPPPPPPPSSYLSPRPPDHETDRIIEVRQGQQYGNCSKMNRTATIPA